MIVSVRRKSDGVELTRYAAQSFTDVEGYTQSEFDHIEYVDDAVETTIDPMQWRIYVGAFFDRFGESKIPVLASDNAIVQALIKDASVRQYVGLVERKGELTQMICLLQTLVSGITLDVTEILETVPTETERWDG